MKKKPLFLVEVLALLLVLFGCSGLPNRPDSRIVFGSIEQSPCIAYFSTRTGARGSYSIGFAPESLLHYSRDLFVANYHGQEIVNVSDNPESGPRSHAWSPDGRHLSWTSERGLEVFTDGRKEIAVRASDYYIRPSAPYAWSPMSDQLAFVGHRCEDGRRVEDYALYLVPLSGGSVVKVTDMKGKRPSAIRWLEKSDTLVWVSTYEGVEALPIREGRPTGSARKLFEPDGGYCSGLSVSTEGSTVATAVAHYNGVWQFVIWTFSVEGKDVRRLTRTENLQESPVCWSPYDKNLVAFNGSRIDPVSRKLLSAPSLYLCQVDSGDVSVVETDEAYWSVGSPSWSPDGRYIAAVGARKDNTIYACDILILDVATLKWSRFTDSAEIMDDYPLWRPVSSSEFEK